MYLIWIDFPFAGAQHPHKNIHIHEHFFYFVLCNFAFICGYQCLREEKKHSGK